MQSRSLPDRPNLDHLKNEAKALHKTLRENDPDVKLTDAQRQVAREYGFETWAKLRAHVQNVRAADDGVTAFLRATPPSAFTRTRSFCCESSALT